MTHPGGGAGGTGPGGPAGTGPGRGDPVPGDRNDIPYTSPRTGEERATEQVRITVEGLRYLHRRMGGTAPLSVGPLSSPAGSIDTPVVSSRPGLTA